MSNVDNISRGHLDRITGTLFKDGYSLDTDHDPNLQRTLRWVPVTESLPDDEMTVLLDYDGEAWPGTYDGEAWHDLTGMPIVADVLHWCEFPEVP